MKKKIMLFLFVLFLGASWEQTVSAQSIRAWLYDYSYINPNMCTYTLNVGVLYYVSGLSGTILKPQYCEFDYTPLILIPHFTYASYGATSVWGWEPYTYGGPDSAGYAPCSSQVCAQPIQLNENNAYNLQLIILGECTAPGGDDYVSFTQSNIPQFINPINAPIGSAVDGPLAAAILVSYNLITHTNDPVNIATGEDYFSSTDFSLSGRGPKLALFRKYRSFATFNGMFGYGWRTDFDTNLTIDASGNVVIYDGEGTGTYFMNNSGTYTNSPGNYSTLIRNADGSFTITDKHGMVKHYDISGRMTSMTDLIGNTLSFVYNPAQTGGTYIQDASGRQIKLTIDSHNHIISSQDPSGHAFQYSYDVNGNLVSVTDPTGAVTNYNYDSNHKIIQFINANGHITYYQYDSQGRVTTNMQDNNVNKVTLNYIQNYLNSNDISRTVVTDSLGNNNTYVFNSYGLMTSHTDPLGAVTQQSWDPMMNLLSRTDAKNQVTNFMNDSNGNLIQIIDPLGNQTNMTYTPNFNLISTKTDALGNVTNYVYDIKGNLTAVIDALGKTHNFTYDHYGNAVTATDALGNTTNFNYDSFSHVVQNTDALSDITSFTYDARGNLLSQTNARNYITSFQYDNLNRLLKTTFSAS